MSGWDGDDPRWPQARLSNLGRLRALAAGLPGVALHERSVEAHFDEVWGFVGDLERSVPQFDTTVRSVRIVSRQGDDLRVVVSTTGRFLRGIVMDVTLHSGWCWMVARPRLYVVGMAADPEGDRTRFGLLEGFTAPWPWPLTELARPLLAAGRLRRRRHVRRDVDGIEAALGL